MAPVTLLVALACGGDDLVLPSDGSPASPSSSPTQLQMAGGNGQVGTAGSPLPDPVRVQLLDESGSGMPGQTISWVVSTGDGSATPQSTTDEEGYAEATWTLGSPGSNTLNAVVSGLGHVTFTATATDNSGGGDNGGGESETGTVPSAAASTVSADPASIQVGGEVSTIRVTVRDDAGLPVPGAVVTLSASGSGNTLTQPPQQTGNDGVAVGTLKSDVAGTKDVMASVNGTMRITQTAQIFVTAAPPSRIAAVEGNDQSAGTGQLVPVPPAVRVTNALGEPVAGVEVTFAVTKGGGSVGGASQVTNVDGIARVGSWTLGPNAGKNTLQARAGSLNGSPVVFEATATAQGPPPPPPPAAEPDHFVYQVGPHDVKEKEWFTIRVAIADASGNVVPLNGTQIYIGLIPLGQDTPVNAYLRGDRFVDTQNGVAEFTLAVDKKGTYRLRARSDFLPKNLGPFGPELFSNTFEVR